MRKIKFFLNFEDIWLWLTLYISAGALVYFIYALNWLGLIASFLIASILYLALQPNLKKKAEFKAAKIENQHAFWLFSGLSLLLIIVGLLLVAEARTDRAIISPWTVINPWFLIMITGASLSLLAALRSNASHIYKQILLSAYYLSVFSIAAIIYRLGYGFDPFIHQAAMTEINQFGFILPKTPYYLGQYHLIISLHKLSGLSLFLLNQWFLPIFSALSLACLLPYLHRHHEDLKSAWTASFLLLLLGFSPLIMTTPQNFSYLLLLFTVIFIYKRATWPLIIATSLATFAVHPLAGIPALLLAAWAIINQANLKNKFVLFLMKPGFIFVGALTAFIFSLWAVSGFSSFGWQSFNLSLLNPILANQESYQLNLAYFLINNYFWLLLGGALIILFKRKGIWTEKNKSQKAIAKFLGLSALAALAAYLISRGFSFNGLIAYEQDNYAARLPIIALIILVPLYWELFYYLSKLAKKQSAVGRILITLGISLMMLVSVYGSYPRFDHYFNARGYSTSAADVKAVQRAEELADGEIYITLANQQSSAAALRELGFRHYLPTEQGEIYFYPIPTGGPLYQYFLDMVYKQANRDTMMKAMDFAGVNRAYLIINRYWWASDKIVAEAKLSADSWEKINQGKAYLFEYTR